MPSRAPTMEPGEARTKLLRQHDRLRELIGVALAAAGRLLRGASENAELQRALEELRLAFAAHNASEEALLVPILERDPAWGPARVARMMDEHRAEHATFREVISGTDAEVAGRLVEVAEDIEAHMAAEERTFLSQGVLRS